ncbi:Imm32 family immunity protein [Streptomyces europaeiscabiei]
MPHTSGRPAWKAAGGEIVIETNASGLKTLASLTLAQDGSPDGPHLHLEENNGLEEGVVSPCGSHLWGKAFRRRRSPCPGLW